MISLVDFKKINLAKIYVEFQRIPQKKFRGHLVKCQKHIFFEPSGY